MMAALLSPPGVERGSAKDMFLFVNGRWVRDKSIRFAVLRGYHSHLLRGKYPVVALFLTMDPALIDANVHPAKTEVRLQYANEIHSMIAGAVRDALRHAEWAAPTPNNPELPFHSSRPSSKSESFPSSHGASHRVSSSHGNERVWSSPAPREPVWKDVTPSFFNPIPSRLSGDLEVKEAPSLFPSANTHKSVCESIPWAELCYMGSVADCYLMFSHGDRSSGARMLVLDQHAFHERVIYERLIRDHDLLSRSQPLLVPEAVSLSPSQMDAIKEMEDSLKRNGFNLEFISADTIEVRSVPVILAKSDLQVLLESLASSAGKQVPLDDNSGLAHEILSTIACHSAVRAGEALGEQELKILLNEAKDVDFFHNCPHGRRVFRWWDESQIARWFDR
jgi:DNA mismatch repair protein MutL